MRKSKQKFTLTQTALILGALGAVGGTANAQWAVTNVNDPIYFGPTGIFTQLVGHMINSSKAATDQGTAMSEIQRKQTFQLQEDADQRGRLSAGQLAVAQKISAIRPTLEACSMMSKGVAKASASRTSAGGSGAAGGQPAPNPKGRAEEIRNAEQNFNTLLSGPRTERESLALIVETRKNLDTCSEIDVATKFGGCINGPKEGGKFAGTGQLPPSDISPLSLFGNTNKNEKINKEGEFASRSIPFSKATDGSNQTVEVSKAYINNLLTNGMPRIPDPSKLSNNPEIMGQYRVYQQRIESSSKALRDILSLTIAPETPINPASVAGKHWEEAKTKYQALLGMKAPATPSMRDHLYYQVSNDYMGVPPNTPLNGDQLLQAMNERLAAANYISFKQLEAIENMNVQLATINANQIAPFNYSGYMSDINKAENNKSK